MSLGKLKTKLTQKICGEKYVMGNAKVTDHCHFHGRHFKYGPGLIEEVWLTSHGLTSFGSKE